MTLYIDMASRCGIVTIVHDDSECTGNLGERPMDSGQIQKLEFFLNKSLSHESPGFNTRSKFCGV